MVTRVKICGLTREADARLAVEFGAHALGFVFEPSSKRFLGQVPDWIGKLPPYVSRVAVFGQLPVQFNHSSFHAVQGFGASWTENRAVQRIAVVRCSPGDTPEEILARAGEGEAVLLDAHVEGEFGGTGQKIDWQLAAEVVSASQGPVILAGGLTPENVAEAIRTVRPYAVDVSSGVEAAPGIKDPGKLRAFFQAVRETESLD